MKLKHIFLIAVFLIAAAGVFAAPGNLDPTFNGNGVVRSNIFYSGTGAVEFRTLAIQPDQKIVVTCGTLVEGADQLVARYNADGTRDTTFGSDGLFVFPGQNNLSGNRSAALQPDGRIIVAGAILGSGAHGPGFYMNRVNPNGTLDTTFGVNGYVVTREVDRKVRESTAIVLQPDGKIT